MQEIVSSVKHVADIIAEISAASQEQSVGISHINDAIIRMDDTTQQNTALVEQAAAAAESLMEQADELMNTVSVFSIEGVASAPRSAPVRSVTSVPRNKPSKVVSKPPVAQSYAKTGTDDADWAEF
jgi:methyl-accepting chemotaxis protein